MKIFESLKFRTITSSGRIVEHCLTPMLLSLVGFKADKEGMTQILSEDTMIRLFNSVVRNDQAGIGVFAPIVASESVLDDGKSAESLPGSCRICRYNRSDMQVSPCPCSCKGSVGYVHMYCLKRWILHRRDNRCEICNQVFNIPEEKTSFSRMFRSFFCGRCFGNIVKNLACSISLLPLANVIFQQVLICMEKVNQNAQEVLTVGEVLLASFALLTSSALFFHFFEYITIRFVVIRNIIRQWWMFGGSEDYEIMELGSDSFDWL